MARKASTGTRKSQTEPKGDHAPVPFDEALRRVLKAPEPNQRRKSANTDTKKRAAQ